MYCRRERLEQIFLLDMEDEEYPFSINPFALPVPFTSLSAIMQARAIDLLMHVFEVLWPEVISQHYLPRYLRAAIIALFYNPGSTLLDMYTFLTNDSFRHRMLQNVPDQSVRQFWQMQYDDLSMAQRIQRVEPLVGRLESLMMGRSLIRNIIGQPQTSINFGRQLRTVK